jgi:hypothetical protein
MEDWAKIRQQFSAGQHSKWEIGRLAGVSRGTVDGALETDRPRRHEGTADGLVDSVLYAALLHPEGADVIARALAIAPKQLEKATGCIQLVVATPR